MFYSRERQGARTTGLDSASAVAKGREEPTSETAKKPFFKVFPSVVLPMFLSLIDQTIVASALPAIAASLGGIENISWVVMAYLLAATVSAPCYGRLGDLLGKREMLITAILVAMTGSIVCALSDTLAQLIAGRVLQGLGGGGLMALSHALIGEAVAPRERGKYQSLFSTTGMSASTVGPVAGGWLAYSFGWQSVFLVTLPLSLLSIFLVFRLSKSSSNTEPFRFDIVGLLLFVCSVCPFLLALHAMQEFSVVLLPQVLSLVGVGIIALLLLYRQEKRTFTPLIPLELVADRTVWRCCALAACHGAALISLLTFLPLYSRLVLGASGTQIGLLLLPLTVGIGIGSISTGLAVSRTGYSAIFPTVGLLAASLLITTFGFLSTDINQWLLSALLFLMAGCLGTAMVVVLMTAQEAASAEQLGSAAGLVQLFRSVGAAVGIAFAGVALFVTLHSTDPIVERALMDILASGQAVLDNYSPEVRTTVVKELGNAFFHAFLAIAAFPLIGSILAGTLPIRRVS